MSEEEKVIFPREKFHPSLLERVEEAKLNPNRLRVAIEVSQDGKPNIKGRHQILLSDSEGFASWDVPSLRELFRGTNLAPPDLKYYPPAYAPFFYLIEMHVLVFSDNVGEKTDEEFEEIFSNLRRRPDGRSLGVLHDYLWQAAALLLGITPLSAEEFEGIFGRLSRSAQSWRTAPSSRNYVNYLRSAFY
jgi:hypothetical protein